jgi:hypothetical protein
MEIFSDKGYSLTNRLSNTQQDNESVSLARRQLLGVGFIAVLTCLLSRSLDLSFPDIPSYKPPSGFELKALKWRNGWLLRPED